MAAATSNLTRHSHNHTTLGQLTGLLTTPSTVQFRSIPYATIPGRFRQSVQRDNPGPNRDFTAYGATCPQTFRPNDGSSGGPFPGEKPQQYDELECLNLTVTAPLEALPKDETQMNGKTKLLPVMVFIHGGRFKSGSHVSPLYDTSPLAAFSIAQDSPVIMVSLNYRLDLLGFLCSHDISAYVASFNIPEPPGNYALRDQRVAFSWLHSHLLGFGGDPQNITVFGESAGAWSISYHLCSTLLSINTPAGVKKIPPFRRAILQSSPSAQCVSFSDYELAYQRVLSSLSISPSDPHRVEKLLAVPTDDIVAASEEVGIPHMFVLADETLFPILPNTADQGAIINGCDWIDELIIGDTFYEGFIFQNLKDVPISDFISTCHSVLSSSDAKTLLTAYGITPDMNHNLFWTRSMFLVGDLLFSQPTDAVCDSLTTKKIFRYTLTARNPFPGSVYTMAPGHHFLDLLFLFLTLRDRYPNPTYTAIAEGFASRWIKFANGEEPWPKYRVSDENGEAGEGTIAVINGINGWTFRSKEEDKALSAASEEGPRRYEQWKTISQVFSHLADTTEAEEARRAIIGVAGWAKMPGFRWDLEHKPFVSRIPTG